MDSTAPVPDPAAPVPGRRSLIPAVILAGVVLGLVVVGAIVWRLLSQPASAEEVARDFLVATYEGDVARACELSAPAFIDPVLERFDADDCAGLVEATRDDPSVDTGQEAADIELLEGTEEGDTASLRLTAPVGTPGVWTEVELQHVDGEWLVTDFSG